MRGLEGKEAPADGVITGYGKVDGRLVAVCAYDFTVMAGSMGMTGEMKVARLRDLALTKRIPFVWLLDSAGARIQEAVGSLFAGSGHLFREEVVASRRDPAGRGADGAVRGRHRLHPRAGRLRADGQGPRLDGAGRPAPRARRGRRGRHAGGAGRLPRALPQVRRRRPRGGRRRGVHRPHQAVPVVLPVALRGGAAAARRRRPGRPHGRGAARRPARVQPQAVRHVRRDPPDRRRRRVARPQAAVREDDHHLPGADGRAAGRDRRQPAAPARRDPRQRLGRQGRAVREPLQRVRDPARCS